MEASPRKLAPPVPKEAKAKITRFMTSADQLVHTTCQYRAFHVQNPAVHKAAPRCPGLRYHHHHQGQIKSGRMSQRDISRHILLFGLVWLLWKKISYLNHASWNDHRECIRFAPEKFDSLHQAWLHSIFRQVCSWAARTIHPLSTGTSYWTPKSLSNNSWSRQLGVSADCLVFHPKPWHQE